EIIDVWAHGRNPPDVANQPDLLLTADMCQVPHQWRHQRGVLLHQVLVVDRFGQFSTTLSGAYELVRNMLTEPFSRHRVHRTPPFTSTSIEFDPLRPERGEPA